MLLNSGWKCWSNQSKWYSNVGTAYTVLRCLKANNDENMFRDKEKVSMETITRK